MQQGFIGLHRKLMDNPVWADPNYLKLWIYCLFRASHKDHDQLVGNQIVKLERGQFVTGRFALTEDFNKGVKPKQRVNDLTLWRYLNNLEKFGMLNIKTTNKYSVVTIVNYDIYQGGGTKVDHQTEHQMNNKRTTNEQQMNTNNNVNNANNEIKEINNNIGPKELMAFWDKNGFGFHNINSKQKLLAFIDEGVNAEVILKALEVAEGMNKKSYPYVEKVLMDWINRGVKTAEDVQALQKEYEDRKAIKTGAHKKQNKIDWDEV